ncbi:MAG: hypothetical protein JWR83_1892, partial [Aeromicrobium sp.]|nr:hypothetical protein [Aeromicrobium sp.]
MRALGLALVASVLFLAGIQPAAASSTPSKVGLVSFVAASYSPSSHTASLTIDWPNTSHATKYEIFMSRHSSMSLAKKYNSISSTKRFAGLVPGGNYFFQVRGVNGSQAGSKSNRVGHTATRDQGSASGPTYRVMTYNVCSRVCDEKQTTKYSWARRQPPAFERVATYKPDVLAAQEADNLDAPPGYTRALYKSGKKLFYKTNRFDLATGSVPDSQSCGDTQPPQQPVNGPRTGFV